jgi:hypothetical protein
MEYEISYRDSVIRMFGHLSKGSQGEFPTAAAKA